MENSKSTLALNSALSLIKPFSDIKKCVNPSNSQMETFDKIVMDFLKEKIEWKNLQDKHVLRIAEVTSCFQSEGPASNLWRKYIISLGQFSNETIFMIVNDKNWSLLHDELATAVKWDAMGENEAIMFCESFREAIPSMWKHCYERVTFTQKGLLEFGKKCPVASVKTLVFEKLEKQLEEA